MIGPACMIDPDCHCDGACQQERMRLDYAAEQFAIAAARAEIAQWPAAKRAAFRAALSQEAEGFGAESPISLRSRQA
jgi:hypothetical protein